MITEAQRKARMLGIGGSDMPIILGLSSYKTPYQLYLEKIGETLPEERESDLQYWGNQLEAIVRDEFIKRHGVEVQTPDTLHHPDYDFMLGNLDGFIPQYNAVLEIKTTNQFMAKEWGESGSDIIPLSYLVQVAHYCAVTNAEGAYIAVLIGGNDYRELCYTRDLALEARLIEEGCKFWSCVQTRTEPTPINIDDLRLKYPSHTPEKTKTIIPNVAQQISALSETRFKIKELNDVEEKYKFNVMQFMEDAECLVDESGRPIVSWKANKRGSRTFLMKGI